MGSDLWFHEFERILAEKEDAAVEEAEKAGRILTRTDFDRIYNRASEEVDGALRDRLADMADRERTRRKEEAAEDAGLPEAKPSTPNLSNAEEQS